MFRERATSLQGISLFLDVCCLCLAFFTAFLLRVFHESLPILNKIPAVPWAAEQITRSDYAALLAVSTVTWVLTMRGSRLYVSTGARPFAIVAAVYLRSIVIAILAVAFASFVLKLGSISRIFFFHYFVFAFLFVMVKQGLVSWLVQQVRQSGTVRQHVVIMGGGEPVTWFTKLLVEANAPAYSIEGMVLKEDGAARTVSGVPVIGTVDAIDTILQEHPVDEVFLVGGAADIMELGPAAQKLIEKGRIVSLVTTMTSGQHGVAGRITEFAGVPMISFGPMPKEEVGYAAKRILDVAASATALLVLLPAYVFVALAIKVFDPGPVIFRQKRLGLKGEAFDLYKFRSMRRDAEAVLRADEQLYERYIANDYKLADAEDPRITALGRFLRKSSLDELPQFWNVLRGDMSLVGPRPIVPGEIEKYEPYSDLLLAVKPGLTGHWQVGGRSEIQYPDRAFMEFDYIGNNSLTSDISIILRTVPAILKRKGAH